MALPKGLQIHQAQLSRLVSEKEGYDSQGTSIYMFLSILTLASEAITHTTILEEISIPGRQSVEPGPVACQRRHRAGQGPFVWLVKTAKQRRPQ